MRKTSGIWRQCRYWETRSALPTRPSASIGARASSHYLGEILGMNTPLCRPRPPREAGRIRWACWSGHILSRVVTFTLSTGPPNRWMTRNSCHKRVPEVGDAFIDIHSGASFINLDVACHSCLFLLMCTAITVTRPEDLHLTSDNLSWICSVLANDPDKWPSSETTNESARRMDASLTDDWFDFVVVLQVVESSERPRRRLDKAVIVVGSWCNCR